MSGRIVSAGEWTEPDYLDDAFIVEGREIGNRVAGMIINRRHVVPRR